MHLALITLGDPDRATGGHLYNARMAGAATTHGADIEFLSIAPGPSIGSWLSARKVVARARRSDVVLLDSLAAAFTIPWLRRVSRPTVAIVHQAPGGPLRKRFHGRLDLLAYARASRLIAVSESLASKLRANPSLSTTTIDVVPPGRDLPGPLAATSLDLRRGHRCALVCVANWLPHKGLIALLDACAELPRQSAILHLIGAADVDPGYSSQILARLARADLRDRVVVHGAVPSNELGAYLREADIFVLPAEKETYGTAFAEALGAGLPVVGVRAGNVPNLVRHGTDGLLVDPGDAKGLGTAIQTLIEDDALRARISGAAREGGLALPTWAESSRRFFEIIRETAGRGG